MCSELPSPHGSQRRRERHAQERPRPSECAEHSRSNGASSPGPVPSRAAMKAVAWVAFFVACCTACDTKTSAPRPASDAGTRSASIPATPSPVATTTQPKTPAPDASVDAGPQPHAGPWFVVTASAAGIYERPMFDDKTKLGWARNGARIPVEPAPVSKERCTGGWYSIVDGGHICGNQGTVDPKDPALKLSMHQPDLTQTLPYKYVRNAKNGTPLYRSVPSREQMLAYEPYLSGAKDAKRPDEQPARAARDAGIEQAEPSASVTSDAGNRALQDRIGAALAEAGIEIPDEPAGEEPDASQPWWQKTDAKDELHKLKLEDLSADADDVLSRRMVTGFYVAVDRTFRWNGRSWYKTTRGLVTPADRFWAANASDFHGVELGKGFTLPIAWVYGGRKSTNLYQLDGEDKPLRIAGSVKRFEAIQLAGRVSERAGRRYHETSAGLWIQSAHVRMTAPDEPPKDVGPREHWLAVNLKQQTLVAFEGTTPVYATLISSGKESRVKEKDHRTPVGQWRIREKHLTTTMDGDGTAAGDMPYSIEDVPFVMYFYRAYAVHGAFWHSNFGVQMSHGCINLAPLDAKWLFLFLQPFLPRGWHGVWARGDGSGSRIVVHE